MIDYTPEHLFSYTGTLAATPEVIGPVAEGIRVTFYSTGGDTSGRRSAAGCVLSAATG